MDSINVDNSIDKIEKCEDMYFWILYIEDDKNKTIKSHEKSYLYLLMIQNYLLTCLCSILWIYQQLDDSRKISNFVLDTSWCILASHFFTFLTPKVVQHEKVKMKQPKASVIYGLKNMEQRTFLHQINQFSYRDRYPTARFIWKFDYTLVLHFPNHLHHCQWPQSLICSSLIP